MKPMRSSDKNKRMRERGHRRRFCYNTKLVLTLLFQPCELTTTVLQDQKVFFSQRSGGPDALGLLRQILPPRTLLDRPNELFFGCRLTPLPCLFQQPLDRLRHWPLWFLSIVSLNFFLAKKVVLVLLRLHHRRHP